MATTTEIWSQLPDDVIKHIGEYWDDYKERLHRRIFKIVSITSPDFHRFNDAKTLLKKLEMPIPQVINELGQKDWTGHMVSPWEIKLTEKCCIINRPRLNGRNYRFNIAQNSAKKYDEWLRHYLGNEIWRNVMSQWQIVLDKQYPAMSELAMKDFLKERLKRRQAHHQAVALSHQQKLEKILRERQEKEELIKVFGTVPQYITSL
jgi:hypothetical protein